MESDVEENWPVELVEIRNKFTSSAKREIESMKELHTSEITRLKQEYARNLSRAIERHQEEMNKMMKSCSSQKIYNLQSNGVNEEVDSNLVQER